MIHEADVCKLLIVLNFKSYLDFVNSILIEKKMDNWNNSNNNSSRIWSGIIILGLGMIFLLRNFGLNLPGWLLSWPMVFILIGLLIGFKRNFNGGGWLILVLIGGYFTLRRIDGDFVQYYFAAAFIIMGLYLILKPKSNKEKKIGKRWERKFAQRFNEQGSVVEQDPVEARVMERLNADSNDILDSVSVFGGSHQVVHSKNFKGGDVIAVFGGCDVNLTQADFDGVVVLDVLALFGGVKIVVPPSWEVKSDVVAIFGGLDDKRSLGPINAEPSKILKIEGVTIFGGVEIRNY